MHTKIYLCSKQRIGLSWHTILSPESTVRYGRVCHNYCDVRVLPYRISCAGNRCFPCAPLSRHSKIAVPLRVFAITNQPSAGDAYITSLYKLVVIIAVEAS